MTEPAWTRPWALLALGLGFALLLAARNTDVLLRPEFWAEDGWVWFPDGYQYGWASLVRPVAGYLQTVSRLVGLLAQAFPLAWAPAVFAVMALLFQVLPPLFLVSSRVAAAWGDARGRLLFALMWLALPNTWEVYVNLTNSQWHLAVLAFLVLLSRPALSASGRAFDVAVLVVSGLSGPFCIILAPVAAWLAATRRDRTSVWRAGIVFAAAGVQALFVLASVGDRSQSLLGATPDLLARIVAQQVLFGALGGQDAMQALPALETWQSGVLPWAATAAAVVLAGLALARGSQAIRLSVLAAGFLFTATLARPQISMSGAQWPYMLLPGVGQRYYYIPMLAWLAVLFAWAGSHVIWRRVLGGALLAVLAFGIWSDWTMPARRPSGFAEQVQAFERAAPGTVWTYEFNPLFEQVPMRLVKR